MWWGILSYWARPMPVAIPGGIAMFFFSAWSGITVMWMRILGSLVLIITLHYNDVISVIHLTCQWCKCCDWSVVHITLQHYIIITADSMAPLVFGRYSPTMCHNILCCIKSFTVWKHRNISSYPTCYSIYNINHSVIQSNNFSSRRAAEVLAGLWTEGLPRPLLLQAPCTDSLSRGGHLAAL